MSSSERNGNWLIVLIFGSFVIAVSMGIRQVFGLFLRPVAIDLGLSFSAFGMAMGLQNIIWGLSQPLAGLWSDNFGVRPVVIASGVIYFAGLAVVATASDTASLVLGLGILVGLGQSGTAFAVILALIGRSAPPARLGVALSLGSMASSLGICVLTPLTVALLGELDWRAVMWFFAGLVGLIPILALCVGSAVFSFTGQVDAHHVSSRTAVRSAGTDRDFWLLNISFGVCGFLLSFISTYLPSMIVEAGLGYATGAGALAAIGVANVAGTYLAGQFSDKLLRTQILSVIYVARAVAIVAFLVTPLSSASVLVFAAAMGLMWTVTVPLTTALVATLWGQRNLSFLFGIVYVGHQVGAFAGALGGGIIRDITGSFDLVWIFAAVASVASAVVHLVISETPRPIALAELSAPT
jgi:predicted MFS family arabinose efflux permease